MKCFENSKNQKLSLLLVVLPIFILYSYMKTNQTDSANFRMKKLAGSKLHGLELKL